MTVACAGQIQQTQTSKERQIQLSWWVFQTIKDAKARLAQTLFIAHVRQAVMAIVLSTLQSGRSWRL